MSSPLSMAVNSASTLVGSHSLIIVSCDFGFPSSIIQCRHHFSKKVSLLPQSGKIA